MASHSMLRPVRPLIAALLGLSVACWVRRRTVGHRAGPRLVEAFGTATKAKDYQRLCDELLAPNSSRRSSAGLPCEVALRQGLGEVARPTCTIGRIEVKGDNATADVRAAAAGEEPSRTTSWTG